MTDYRIVGAYYLRAFQTIRRELLFGDTEYAKVMAHGIDADDLDRTADELGQHNIRVATDDEVTEPVLQFTGSLPRLVTSAGQISSRPCDPV